MYNINRIYTAIYIDWTVYLGTTHFLTVAAVQMIHIYSLLAKVHLFDTYIPYYNVPLPRLVKMCRILTSTLYTFD